MKRQTYHHRRGTAYVAVLGLALVLLAIALGASLAGRVQARASDMLGDAAEARLYAQSAIELGRLWIAQDPHWRTNRGNGAWVTNQSLGTGTFSLQVVNPNGDLSHADTDPVILSATGVKGQARQMMQVTLTPNLLPLSCLTAAVTAGGTITCNGATVQAANQTIASNAGVTTSGGNLVKANVEAVTAIAGGTYAGSTTAGVAARALPDHTALDYYVAQGTAIPFASIPAAKIQDVVLSPASNPYGATNAQGIYVIDCQGNNLIITDCRIVGTLVVLNPGNGSSVQAAVNWVPAVSNYPCLLVQGDFNISTGNSPLAEGPGKNYNPPGTPYPYAGGAANSTTDDTYPSVMDGMVYVSGNLSTTQNPSFRAVVVAGTLTISGTLNLTYDPTSAQNPPPGFRVTPIPMVVSPGTWKQVTD